ncbi:hypothetical protein [Streptomyces sp. TRM68367]|nr:hypothetical protein [Streptomyces sp. TRM68367]MBC9727786.1 hypothetical protein [Streptomyces sp. TRM68367]
MITAPEKRTARSAPRDRRAVPALMLNLVAGVAVRAVAEGALHTKAAVA